MHFVKKVPTSEEEKAARKKEQDKKSKIFLTFRNRIIEKKENGEFDDEMLSLTQQVLEKNADIYTFWNLRRICIELKLKSNEAMKNDATIPDDEKLDFQRKTDNLLSGELFLSYECIKTNPKSYSAWFQRAWVLKHQVEPDLKKEFGLCEKALQLDCRNFHCWDHRRFVAKLANLTNEEELEFSNKLIEENFSNYSAWHYRSIGLKNLSIANEGQLKIDENTIAEELNKVKNAFYMDAEDQSAWTYTRWLLEVGSGKEFLRPDSRTPEELISACFDGSSTTLVFTRAVTLQHVLSLVDTDNDKDWIAYSSTSPNPKCSKVWKFMNGKSLKVLIQNLEKSGKDAVDEVEIDGKGYLNEKLLRKIYDASEITIPASISALLDDCKQLMELEPENKWPLYMRTLIQMEYDPVGAHEEIIGNLTKLAEELDVNRRELYLAIQSRQHINAVVRENLDKYVSGECHELTVNYKGLTSTEGVEYLSGIVTRATFQGNQLKDIARIVLPNLEFLCVNENPIKKITASPNLNSIKFLQIASTQVKQPSDIVDCIKKMEKIKKLLICETPLVENGKELAEILQPKQIRLIIHWL